MITDNYKEFWTKASAEKDAKKYILPGRTESEFWEEGEKQAAEMQKWIKPSDTVVEFGCGVGRVLRFIKAKERIGVDVSHQFLTEAAKVGIQPLQTDGLKIDLPDNTADVVYSLMVFQHCPKKDHPQQVAELVRICKPGGKILIQFPREASGYYKESSFVNVYDFKEVAMLSFSSEGLPFGEMLVKSWDLAGYADGKSGKREYLLTIHKK